MTSGGTVQFNFVGKLLGPRGNSMKRLQEETGVKMSILGKGSMRDKGKEEELRKGGEAKHDHLSNDLHVLIEVFAPPGEAYSRMSHALEEIKKFLVPDYNDEIRQEQLRELSLLNGSDESGRGRSAQGRSVRPATTSSTGGHRGTGRSAAAPRGTAPATHGKLPAAVLTREGKAPRARGAAGGAGYRPPLLAVTHEPYDDYGFDDGYGGEYDDESYEAYEDNYSNQSKSISEYYEYGHGTSDESYNNYEEEWVTPRPGLKAPVLRLTRAGYRKQPYEMRGKVNETHDAGDKCLTVTTFPNSREDMSSQGKTSSLTIPTGPEVSSILRPNVHPPPDVKIRPCPSGRKQSPSWPGH
ncbi:KH domain-containing, RNA-binding, signal transduction-associated protein 2 [Liparis tanakae]|uniref:KH domain-containing, RNA-binding, signal transduction-associated protein 2 n=1 Tax=Liparis tanakae TaxID=230148 RepID=A0A4Z2HR14_9TELE|nr:KH domain-containing, RNA-binding, signal transduction-associated protein 2 [Liparis tanakae]